MSYLCLDFDTMIIGNITGITFGVILALMFLMILKKKQKNLIFGGKYI